MFHLLLSAVLLTSTVSGQTTTDSVMIKKIFDESLTTSKAYDWLRFLSLQIGGRLSGSVEAEQAINYTESELRSLGLDRVYLQPVMVPKWVRGAP